MKRLYNIIILISIFCSLITAQNKPFSRLYPLVPYLAATFNSLVVADSSYYITGIVRDSTSPYTVVSLFLKSDLNGVPRIIKSIKDTNLISYETWSQSLSVDENDNLVTNCYNYNKLIKNGRDSNQLFLIKYNKNGEVVLIKSYGAKPDCDQELTDWMVKTTDNQYILSVRSLTNETHQYFLLKLNETGELLWKKDLK